MGAIATVAVAETPEARQNDKTHSLLRSGFLDLTKSASLF